MSHTEMSRKWRSRSGARCGASPAIAGFSLVEIMVASIVLVVGVLGAFAYFTYSRTMLNADAHRRVALEVAASRMEEIRACDCANIASYAEEDTPAQIEGNDGWRTTLIEDIDEDGDATTDYYRATVTVRWTENSRDREVQLVTFRSAYR